MKNSEYWRKRQEELQNLLLEPSENYVKEIEAGYKEAIRELEGRISVWYQRFAVNNNVDIVATKKMLTAGELEELRWDLKEYIAKAQEGSTWARELENVSARVHISRYKALMLQVQDCIENLYIGRDNTLENIVKGVYTESRYRNAYEMYLRSGRETAFDVVDTDKLNRLIAKPWTVDGKNFSDRIWDNKEKLVKTLNQEFTRAFAVGFNPQTVVDRVTKKLDTDRYNAGRLVMTESAYFATKGQIDCYNSLDVEEYEVIGTLDSLTCSTCGSMDGKHYPVTAMEAGATAPPFHPNCRCTTIPYYDNEFTEGEERVARDEEGNTYYTKAKTYEEWKADNVKGENDDGSGIATENKANSEDVGVHEVGKIDKNIYSCITEDIVTEDVIITDNQLQHISERHPDAYEKAIDYVKNVIDSPDYIIEDKHENTGLVIKKIKTESELLQVVLRICTSTDPSGYKNSIISCWEISEKRLKNYLRNKKVLYKKE